MRLPLAFLALMAALSLGAPQRASAQTIPGPGGDIVLTDPLVRAIQIGPPPVGAVTAVNPQTGVGLVAIPGIGVRQAKLVGVPETWAGKLAVRAVDLDTQVEFIALLPTQPQLVAA